MAERARLQVKSVADPEKWEDVGPDGVSLPVSLSSETKYATIIQTDGDSVYVAKAAVGSSTSSACWQVKKIYQSGAYTTVTWADGTDNFDNVATNLPSLSYS